MTREIAGVAVFEPGSDEYASATSPQNAGVEQRPAMVAAPTDAEQVAECVRYAASEGLTVVPQATGHGAGPALGSDILLLDTSRLDTIEIDSEGRSAKVGSGCQWGAVNAQAFARGLLGRSGSAPDVGVAGFTFGAGAGWLTRPAGLASGSLTAVDYVDGRGDICRASDDASDQLNRDAMWAFRGGGGVGIAVSLEFGLVEVPDLWAGYLLWPLDAMDEVLAAWSRAIPSVGNALSTSIALLQAPPSPAIPESLQGQRVVHLAMASAFAGGEADALRSALADCPAPSIDTWGPSDLDRLSQIHLDPPAAVPALGSARWLDDGALAIVGDIFRASLGGPIEMIELRNVENDAPALEGALDRAPGSFMLHAVGDPGADGIEKALDSVIAAAAPAETGLVIGSWSDGRASVADALPPDVLRRVRDIAVALDPHGVIARSAVVAESQHAPTPPVE